MDENVEKNKLVPPYLAYRSFISFIDSLRRGIPHQIDRSLMRNLSGSMQSQVLSAFRYFKLIDHNGVTQESMEALVNSEGEDRAEQLRKLLTIAYPFLFNGFDLTKATATQFRNKFQEAGASGDSIRKGTAFFLSAAKDAQISVSPYVSETIKSQGESKTRKPRITINSGNPAKKDVVVSNLATSNAPQQSWEQALLAKFPSFDPAWPDDVQREWFGAFQQMMKLGKPNPAEPPDEADDPDEADE